MTSIAIPSDCALERLGRDMHALMAELFPIPRSITGNGVRETLRRLGRLIPIELHEVPSGTKVFDWVVPEEWNIRDAYVKNAGGDRIIDFQRSPLHLVNSSMPIRATMPLAELQPHLHSLPDHPDWIPYRYAHYSEAWGFCLSHNLRMALEDGDYEVCIDATREPGALTYGECFLPGQGDAEVLFSCHVCHPAMANDNLSGIAVATFLASQLAACDRRYGYRFIFVPSTIGAIAWLARNEAGLARVEHGLVLSCLGDAGPHTYKRSRQGDAEIDRAVTKVLADSGAAFAVKDFAPYGYDERQFNAPGIKLPAGLLTRTPHDAFSEYHSSADDLDFVQPWALAASLKACLNTVHLLEHNRAYRNLQPKGEPQLGRRGLYREVAGQAAGRTDEEPLLWVLNLSDGEHSLLDIAERSGLAFARVKAAADRLLEAGLLAEA